MANKEGVWLSIIEYSQIKNVSISTIRRHIKANILKHKEEKGKYFVYTTKVAEKTDGLTKEVFELKLENERLNDEVKNLTEQLNEMKMLVQIYEAGKKEMNPPELPC